MDPEFLPIIGGEIIGLVTVILLGTIAILVITFNFKKRELLNKEITAAIRKGVEVPFPERTRMDYRGVGLILIFLGGALTIALFCSSWSVSAAAWGLLPLAAGLAFMMIHRSQGGREL